MKSLQNVTFSPGQPLLLASQDRKELAKIWRPSCVFEAKFGRITWIGDIVHEAKAEMAMVNLIQSKSVQTSLKQPHCPRFHQHGQLPVYILHNDNEWNRCISESSTLQLMLKRSLKELNN